MQQAFIEKGISIPQGSAWHRELLNLSEQESIITPQMKKQLGEFLAFRHFFSHAYALDLYAEKMEPLVKSAFELYEEFKIEISKHY